MGQFFIGNSNRPNSKVKSKKLELILLFLFKRILNYHIAHSKSKRLAYVELKKQEYITSEGNSMTKTEKSHFSHTRVLSKTISNLEEHFYTCPALMGDSDQTGYPLYNDIYL